MFKNTERKITVLLDNMLATFDGKNDSLKLLYYGHKIELLLKPNQDLLTIAMQEKLLKILSIEFRYDIIKLIQSEYYQHLSTEVVKLLDLSEPFYSYEVIQTLYKMGTYQFIDEIRPFTMLNIDDKMPFSDISYREGHSHFVKYDSANGSFRFLNDSANKYIKRANKLTANFKEGDSF